MTEAEWLACTDPQKMLEFLRGKASDRKLRLFACTCCRQIWRLFEEQRHHQIVEDIESRTDHLSPPARPSVEVAGSTSDFVGTTLSQLAVRFVIEALLEDRWFNVPAMCARAASRGGIGVNQMKEEKASQIILLRCIFGNPFRPVTLSPTVLAWNDSVVVRLAQTAYEDRHLPEGSLDKCLLAILADALEEAGCTDADILGHLRGPGPHVRGCWPVDLCLGKS